MMAFSSYVEMLKDPRWQKRRLDILNRDEFTCTECGCTTKTLHVHHRYYLRGKKPWEYDDDALTTLCEDCHDVITEITGSLKPQLGRLSSVQLAAVSGFALGVELSGLMFTGPLKASIAVPFAADSLEASGLAAGLGISRDDIDALAGRGPLTAEGIIELAETRAQDHARRLIEHGRFSVEGYYEDTLS